MQGNLQSQQSQKQALKTNGVPLKDIPNIFIAERYTMAEAQPLLEEGTKPTYSHDEVFGEYCNVNLYINCPVDTVFEYCANVFSLEEWTFSVRGLSHEKNGLYHGMDVLAPNTEIYVRCQSFADSRCVDYLCAWDQSQELWMRYYMRFLDAMPTMGKPGTIVCWLNCKHPFYERNHPGMPKHIMESQARKDRPWVGDLYNFFHAAHMIEAQNMKTILEHRFGNKR